LTLPSEEEEAARRALAGLRPAPATLNLSIPQELLQQAVIDAIPSVVRNSSAIRDFLTAELKKYVAELVPESPEFAALKEETREHLRRYPALGSDPKLQEAVAMAIFGHIQGSNNTYR
jgi:hypothetical protein